MSALKAYLIDCDGEYGAQLYFASTRGRAKAEAANDSDCCIVDILSCRRKPEYDIYAPGPVPPSVLMEDGWWFECSGCGRNVYADEDEDGNELCPVIETRQVWCSPECKRRQEEREAKWTMERVAAERAAVSATVAAFPGVLVKRVNPQSRQRTYVEFLLPDQKTVVSWEVGSKHVGVLPAELEAWERYQDAILRPVMDWESEGGAVA